YFSGNLNAGESLLAVTSDPTAPAIEGINNATGVGVRGSSIGGPGVQGVSVPGPGVMGVSSVNGVFGVANANGPYHGVVGASLGTVSDASGVLGYVGGVDAPPFSRAGVRGQDSSGYGVLGLSATTGTEGALVSNGSILAAGL